MSSLSQFQGNFASAIKADQFDGPLDGADANDAWRLSVYRNNFYHGLIEQLRDAYPTVAQALGDDGFRVVARGYLTHFPPTTRSLALFGEEFPTYLANISLTQEDPVIRGLAQLDRAYLEALHAADANVLDPHRLGELGDNLVEARFGRHPASHIVRSQISLVDHWRVRRSGSNASNSQNSDTGADRASAALVTRPNLAVQVAELTQAEAIFGQTLFESKPVSHAFEAALGLDGAFDITEAFRKFLAAGAFATVSS